eukprot:1026927-Rhodomonas_salina.2
MKTGECGTELEGMEAESCRTELGYRDWMETGTGVCGTELWYGTSDALGPALQGREGQHQEQGPNYPPD